jgi:hypothetical protein
MKNILRDWVPLAVSLAAAAFTALQWLEARHETQLSHAALVGFEIDTDPTERRLGVSLRNAGPGVATVRSVRYFVDRQPIDDIDAAVEKAKLIPNHEFDIELDAEDPVSVGETVWLIDYRPKSKDEKQRAIDFIEKHLSVGVEYCSAEGKCSRICSTKDWCQFTDAAAASVEAVPSPTQQSPNINQGEASKEVVNASTWKKWLPDPLVDYTLLLTIFTAILAAAGVFQFRFLIKADRIAATNAETARQSVEAAKQSAEIAEKSLVAANRPWIKVDIQIGGAIAYNVNGANFKIRYILKNIGNSPATNVWTHPTVTLMHPNRSEPFSPRDEMRKLIANLKDRPPAPFGFALFPGDTAVQDITVSVSNEEIKRATTLIEAIYPTILGAVEYRSGFDDKPHETGFIFEIRRNDVPRPSTTAKNRSPAAIWVDEGDVPAGEIILVRSILDGGYAD